VPSQLKLKILLDKAIVNTVLRLTPTVGLTRQPQIEVLQRLPHWKDGDTYVVQLGDLYAGENRRFMIDIEVPGIKALGLCQIAEITIEYLNLSDRQEISVTTPVNVNVVPGDQAAGRIANPVIRAERLIIAAQSEKATAIEELRSGNSKDASARLLKTVAKLRSEASLIPVTDEASAESLILIRSEADEIEKLAEMAKNEDISYSSKRLTEDFSRKTRARKERLTNPDDIN
jgi:Ca-activated chloride channel homolog